MDNMTGFTSFMPSISQHLKTAFKVGYICIILFIPKAISNLGLSNENITPSNHRSDSLAVGEEVGKFSSSPVEELGIGSKESPLIENVDDFEKDPNDPFVQEITRVGSEEAGMVDMNNLSRKKKFLWFQYGKDESGEARFRTLHGKNYNPYDFDEYDNLNENQYEDKLVSKIGAKVEQVETKPEITVEASGTKEEENLKQQSNSDHEEDLQKSNSAADQLMQNELPTHDDKPTQIENPAGETLEKESADDNDKVISHTQDSQLTRSQLSQSSTMAKPETEMKKEELGSFYEVKKKLRGRKIEDSLMLEFAHNRPDSRILWMNYPEYRSNDDYRLIDEAAERTFITSKEFGFVNTDTYSMKAAGELITYVENNRIGYEVLNSRITREWNQKSLRLRADTCAYLVNNNMMLREYEFIYDSSQSPEHIRAYKVTVLLQIKNVKPRRIMALSCPVIQPNTSLAVTLFMFPVTYVNEDTDEYVFTFVEQDPINYPLHVRLMFLSRLASGDSVEAEFVEDKRINAMDELWWYGNLKGNDPGPTPKDDELTPKNDLPILKDDKLTSKNNESTSINDE